MGAWWSTIGLELLALDLLLRSVECPWLTPYFANFFTVTSDIFSRILLTKSLTVDWFAFGDLAMASANYGVLLIIILLTSTLNWYNMPMTCVLFYALFAAIFDLLKY